LPSTLGPTRTCFARYRSSPVFNVHDVRLAVLESTASAGRMMLWPRASNRGARELPARTSRPRLELYVHGRGAHRARHRRAAETTCLSRASRAWRARPHGRALVHLLELTPPTPPPPHPRLEHVGHDPQGAGLPISIRRIAAGCATPPTVACRAITMPHRRAQTTPRSLRRRRDRGRRLRALELRLGLAQSAPRWRRARFSRPPRLRHLLRRAASATAASCSALRRRLRALVCQLRRRLA